MAVSARNRPPGVIEEVQVGAIMARIIVKLGDHWSKASSLAPAPAN